MNKFITNIVKNNTSIREQRAQRLAKQVEFAQTDLINTLIKEKMELEDKIERLLDFNPKSTTDLSVGSDNFNATSFVNELQDARVRIEVLSRELAVAQGFANEYFVEKAEAEVSEK